jgi:uncharacterized protein YyaL (SSP411 family)
MPFNLRKTFSGCLFLLLILSTGISNAQKQIALKPKAHLLKIIDKSLQQSSEQYHLLMKQLAPDRFPVTFYADKKQLATSGPEPWVAGFYPGTLLYLYEATGDTALYHEALKKLKWLEKEQYNKTTHDLGFMMYCSFGNADRIASNQEYKNILVNSGKSLSTRFNKQVGCTRSWGSGASEFMVIIDNMMNLELLFAATRITGDSSYYKIAISHANTTMKNHFRPDYSSYHLVIYNPETGAVMQKKTVQGAADESAWARGQAWGLYGYTMMYRETKDPKYLQQANHIAHFILNNPNLPKDKIPYWDYDAPGIPNTARDASAGAITCSALIELAGYSAPKEARKYLATAGTMLRSLSSPAYQATVGENEGFILKHGTGNFPKNSDIDVPLIYADYYYIEAMLRYKNLKKKR